MAGRFSPSPVDFSQLNNIASQIIGSINRGQRAKALQDAIASGKSPQEAVLSYLNATGDNEGAARLAYVLKQAQPPSLTPYQAGQLANSRERTDAYTAHLKNLEARQPRIGVVEGLREKLARGETLTPAENSVYQDSLRGDPIMRGIWDRLGGNEPTPPMQPAPVTPQPAPVGQQRTPTPQALLMLKQGANDPAVRQQFDEYYGQGASARVLGVQ